MSRDRRSQVVDNPVPPTVPGTAGVVEGRRHRTEPGAGEPRRTSGSLVEPGGRGPGSDRAWRIGQAKNVIVHNLVCPGTVEERIARVLDSKRATAGQIVGDEATRRSRRCPTPTCTT